MCTWECLVYFVALITYIHIKQKIPTCTLASGANLGNIGFDQHLSSLSSIIHTQIMIIQMQNIDFGGQRGHKDKKSISLKNRCVRYAKSPIAHETFQTMPGLISCAGVTRR